MPLFMVKYFFIALVVLCSFTVTAQKTRFTPPDYKKISKAIEKTGSSTFYPRLMERYLAQDTTLSPKDYHLLYYGFSLQPEYAPLAQQPFADSLMTILHKDQITPDQYNTVIKYCNEILKKSPFDMRYLDPLIYVYRMKGNNDLAARLEFKLGRIIETIFSTGDGLTQETAFHLISASHEFDMLRALGFGVNGKQSLKSGQCDFQKVETNDYGIDGIYFNVSALAGKSR